MRVIVLQDLNYKHAAKDLAQSTSFQNLGYLEAIKSDNESTSGNLHLLNHQYYFCQNILYQVHLMKYRL